MDKFIVRDQANWEILKKDLEAEYDLEKYPEPTEFPCIVIVAYAGAGWYELGFCYRSDFDLTVEAKQNYDHSL